MRSNITLSLISLRFLHLYSKSVENLTLSFGATVNGMHLLPRLHLILLVVVCFIQKLLSWSPVITPTL
jgi:hypothetical protein